LEVLKSAGVEILAASVFGETRVCELGVEVPDDAVDEIADDGGDVGFPLGQLLGAVVVEAAEEGSGGSPPRGPRAMMFTESSLQRRRPMPFRQKDPMFRSGHSLLAVRRSPWLGC
jgi:hypothetical protein